MGLKIILAEEYQLVRAGLRLLIESIEEAEVAGEAGDGETCLAMIKVLKEKVKKPDIILLITEVEIPKKSGLQILKEVKETMQEVRVLILTACKDRKVLNWAVDMNADGYLGKNADPFALKTAIQNIRDGKKYIQNLSLEESEYRKDEKWNILTKREREVLIQIAEGKWNKEIADSLGISERTVKNHLSSIFRKLQVSDRTQAAIYAVRIWNQISQAT